MSSITRAQSCPAAFEGASAQSTTAAGEAAFLRARAATDRGAFGRFKRARGVLSADDAGVKAAHEEFLNMEVLLDENLRALALDVVRGARDRVVEGGERFPAVLWLNGATETWGGREFLGTISDFVLVLRERAKVVAAKRTGWVIEPVTNPEGRRTNDKTLAMHALFLDCDGAGEWRDLLEVLRELRVAHVAYQSGGWTEAAPKWRVVLPLSSPHDVGDEKKQAAWKAIYNHARVVFGALARLRGVGFDPATETPCCPWFLTEKRDKSDVERAVEWSPGHALDLVAMAMALPEWVPDREEADESGRAPTERVALEDEQLEEIVEALAAATTRVASGRRDIYMALPGVLLDRGVAPEDVMQIVEAVSERYPRSHPDKHADNLHCARTTIARWESDGSVTRIGTLQDVAPEVAAAVDDVLPSGDQKFRTMALALMEAPTAIDAAGAEPELFTSTPVVFVDNDGEIVEDWVVSVDNKAVRKFAVNLRRRKRSWLKDKDVKKGLQWELLDRMLRGRALASPPERDALTQLSAFQSVSSLAGMLAYKFPRNTPFDVVRELMRPSLSAMLKDGERVDMWFDALKKAYRKSLENRLEVDEKRRVEEEISRATTRAYYLNGGRF